ncbi:MAG: hypothetical protein AAB347_09310 [Bacteroidota bacterium]
MQNESLPLPFVSFLCDTTGKDFNRDELALPAAAEAQACAGEAAHSRGLSNTAAEIDIESKEHVVVKEKKLLRFGLDWLTLNILGVGSSDCIGFLDAIFGYFDPSEPFDEARDISWIDTENNFTVKFKEAKGDIFAYFKYNNDSIIAVHKITPTTTLRGVGQFNYRIKFYGKFFALVADGTFVFENFIRPFIDEAGVGILLALVSEIHICADIENVTTQWVDKGIKRKSQKLKKTISRDHQNPETGLYDTIYFGQKFKKSRNGFVAADWYVRNYNKSKEIRDNNEERYYKHYLNKELITRVEAAFNSPIFRDYEFSLKNCLDQNCLFALFSKYLRSKDVHFKSVDFIEDHLSDLREVILDKRIKQEPVPISQEKKITRLQTSVRNIANDFGVTEAKLLEELLKEAKGGSSVLFIW